MLDLDHFKLINDRHGHAAGDRVLQATGEICAADLRTCDLLFRLGGEEFAIILPGCAANQAVDTAERIRYGPGGRPDPLR
jgi:diguanylate cyclase (GGDEF)-like protein